MATLILTAVGTAVGGPIGGAIGAIVGQQIDQAIFAPAARQGPRLSDLTVQTSTYGTPIPQIFGRTRVAGTVIWSTDLIETRKTQGGGKGRAATETYSYNASFAVLLSARRIVRVERIWADGKLLRGSAGDLKVELGALRIHAGDADQAIDPLIASAEVTDAPAYRGLAYAVFEGLQLGDYGNRIPSLSFEVVADEASVGAGSILAELAEPDVVADAGPVLGGFAATGTNVRAVAETLGAVLPLAPVHLSATVMSSGDTEVRWVRRSREGWIWRDGVDAPLAEERELYRVVRTAAGASVATDVADAVFVYTAAMRAADVAGGVSSTSFAVAQVGAAGLSPAAPLILSLI